MKRQWHIFDILINYSIPKSCGSCDSQRLRKTNTVMKNQLSRVFLKKCVFARFPVQADETPFFGRVVGCMLVTLQKNTYSVTLVEKRALYFSANFVIFFETSNL